MKKSLLLGISLVAASLLLQAQKISRVEPLNWWVGMVDPNVQLLIYGENIGQLWPSTDHPGVSVTGLQRVPNENYLFVDLHITPEAKPGTVVFTFSDAGNERLRHEWELAARNTDPDFRQGFDNRDVLYLITPDRFANGEPNNDNVKGMTEQTDRSFRGGRHGGDIAGIRQHLDYIREMGFTAIWLNPLLENNMAEYSYHGYSTTDFYQVDPRFGTNEDYRQLAAEGRAQGIKLIMDMVVNHCGSEHWWMNDLPTPDWINNNQGTYVQTNHRKTVLQDPHVAQVDKVGFTDGWFVPTMPDLNQRNPLMATYLTQNAIWWVEYLGLAGIRMDTYPYPDEDYMAEWTRRLTTEFPYLNIVGEEWFGRPSQVSYWQVDKNNPNGYTSYLPSLMDFPLQTAIVDALKEEESFSTGWITAYEMLAQDFLYPYPHDLVVFPDNHDMSRIYQQVGEDEENYRIALAYFLTTRGVPQLYYGTEILMTNPPEGDHGDIRADFPGGWSGDDVNGFTGEGLQPNQRAAQSYLRSLLNWRQTARAVHEGRMLHYLPEKGIYTYFRIAEGQRVMVLLNKNETSVTLTTERFQEGLGDYTTGQDVISKKNYDLTESLVVPARTALILELVE